MGLRAIQRHGYTPPDDMSPEKLSILKYPQWLVERYYRDLGPEGARPCAKPTTVPPY